MTKKIIFTIFTMIRPKIGICLEDLVPLQEKKSVKKLERIQRIVTKVAPELKDVFQERLKEMDLPTLDDRGVLITNGWTTQKKQLKKLILKGERQTVFLRAQEYVEK